MDLIQIGKFMAALRKEQGYTQEQLAAADSRAGIRVPVCFRLQRYRAAP